MTDHPPKPWAERIVAAIIVGVVLIIYIWVRAYTAPIPIAPPPTAPPSAEPLP